MLKEGRIKIIDQAIFRHFSKETDFVNEADMKVLKSIKA